MIAIDLRSSLQAVLDAEAQAIASVQVTAVFERAVWALHDATGKVITTGMGKAGLMARKCAATLCSTGTPAVFLHPGDAAHGDLGVIGRGDVLLAFSTSGKTAEVIETIAAARRLGVPLVVGVTSHLDSALPHCCDLVLDMGPIQEPCHMGLTPSASSAVMLAIGDALALTVARVKQITRADFGVRHRAGYLGEVTR